MKNDIEEGLKKGKNPVKERERMGVMRRKGERR